MVRDGQLLCSAECGTANFYAALSAGQLLTSLARMLPIGHKKLPCLTTGMFSGSPAPVPPQMRHNLSRETVTFAVFPSNASSKVRGRAITVSGALLVP